MRSGSTGREHLRATALLLVELTQGREWSMEPSMASPDWQKSTYSMNGDCVEWRITSTHVHVRNSKDPLAGTIAFTHSEWRAFISGVLDGQAVLP